MNSVSNTAGRLENFYKEWETITSDRYVLNAVKGFKLPFISKPLQAVEPRESQMSEGISQEIDSVVQKLLGNGAIVRSVEEKGQFVSRIFTVPKSDGGIRPVINLKALNEYVQADHFKMEDVRTAKSLIQIGFYMAVIDQKDAYHAVPVHISHQKYLKFRWRGILYQYTCVPFGLNVAPRLYTKLMRPVLKFLRQKGVLCVQYLDDCLIISKDFDDCSRTITTVIELYEKLGLNVNREKSQLVPSTRVKYLGFIIDSNSFCLEVPGPKKHKIIKRCEAVLTADKCKVLELAELVGTLVSICPGVQYGKLHVRQLECDKADQVRRSGGSYEGSVEITSQSRDDLRWWIKSLPVAKKVIDRDVYDLEIYSDSSKTGWGAHFGELKAKGSWTVEESKLHINVLELLAVFNGLKCFVKDKNLHVLCHVDNTTAVAYINKYGGNMSVAGNKVARAIWKFCEERQLRIYATYINTKSNVIADSLSRMDKDASDFMLSKKCFQQICGRLFMPDVDLFASQLTTQCERYWSWYPDPMSEGADAFTCLWKDEFYAFPPFNMIGRVLNKICQDRCTGIVVAPFWPTQWWFPYFISLCVTDIMYFEPRNDLLYDPYTNRSHKLSTQVKIMAAVLSSTQRKT